MWHQISAPNPGEKNDSPKGGLVTNTLLVFIYLLLDLFLPCLAMAQFSSLYLTSPCSSCCLGTCVISTTITLIGFPHRQALPSFFHILLFPLTKPNKKKLEVRAIAARSIYKSLTIHCLAAPVTQKAVPLHNRSATEMVTLFGKASTSYCAVIAGQTTVTLAHLHQCDRGTITGYSISGHWSVTAGPAKSASTVPYKNESHKWDS